MASCEAKLSKDTRQNPMANNREKESRACPGPSRGLERIRVRRLRQNVLHERVDGSLVRVVVVKLGSDPEWNLGCRWLFANHPDPEVSLVRTLAEINQIAIEARLVVDRIRTPVEVAEGPTSNAGKQPLVSSVVRAHAFVICRCREAPSHIPLRPSLRISPILKQTHRAVGGHPPATSAGRSQGQ